MYGYFTKDGYVFGGNVVGPVDTDDKYRCSCGCQVEFASPPDIRSLESQAQAKTRLCSECITKRKVRVTNEYVGITNYLISQGVFDEVDL